MKLTRTTDAGLMARQGMMRNSYEDEPQWELEYLTFPSLSRLACIRHLFTTRTGGVSEGMFATLNLSFSRGDRKDAVLENFRRIAAVLGADEKHIVCTDQTHTTNVRVVTAEDSGKGVVCPRDYTDVDGLVTNEKGLALATFFADCVPLYFVDPVKGVIGLSHSGWRGTVAQMGRVTVEKMREVFCCDPQDIYAAIGPSICKDCYEVSRDVADAYMEGLKAQGRAGNDGADAEQGKSERMEVGHAEAWQTKKKPPLTEAECQRRFDMVFTQKDDRKRQEQKYQMDLWKANELVLLGAGILPEHIEVTDLCTAHNPDYLFSHRASHGKRGNLGAFLMLI